MSRPKTMTESIDVWRRKLREQTTTGMMKCPAVRAKGCNLCNDVGFIRGNFPVGHPQFGKVKPCPQCNQRARTFPDRWGMLPNDYDLEWGDLLNFPGSNALQALATVREVIESGCGGVYLWGAYGVAKTAILKITSAEWIRTGKHGAYVMFSDLLDELRGAYDQANPQAAAMEQLREWQGSSMLAIDELDKARSTEFVNETRFRIFDRRYERATREGTGVTLIASNAPPSSLPRALQSRFSDARFMQVVELTGRDVRPIMGKL